VRRFILFEDEQHPKDMGVSEVTALVTRFVVEGAFLRRPRTKPSTPSSFSTSNLPPATPKPVSCSADSG
jgi:hypothetical protein